MDNKALYKLSYGVFMLASKDGDRKNGCITNTCMQVASNPARIAISSITTNYTCELIKKSGLFTLSMLDNTVTFDTIKHFGFQSGHDVDKFKDLQMPVDAEGIPYMGWAACAVLSGRVVSSQDLGSHMLFVAEVTDAKVLSQNPPLTYATPPLTAVHDVIVVPLLTAMLPPLWLNTAPLPLVWRVMVTSLMLSEPPVT